MAVITSQVRLRGQEVRFLRSLMHRSQTELANDLGLRRITVARWEGAPNTVVPGPADRALRITVANVLFEPKALCAVADLFSEISDERPELLFMRYLPDERSQEPSLFPQKEGEGETWKIDQKKAGTG